MDPENTPATSEDQDLDFQSELDSASELGEESEEKETDEGTSDGSDETDEVTELPAEGETELEESDEEAEDPEDFSYEVQGRVSFGELRKTYPDIFKKFPALREELGRVRGYGEVFPTVEEAREASQTVARSNEMVSQLTEGVSAPMLQAMASENPEAYAKFVKNFIPTLRAMDNRGYYAVITPAIVDALGQIQTQAKAAGNKNLFLSVQHISHALFGKTELPEIKYGDPDLGNKPKPQNEEAQALLSRQFEHFQADLIDTTASQLRRQVLKETEITGIKDTKYRDYVINEIMTQADQLMQRDPLYQSALRSFRNRINKGDMSPQTKREITLAYLRRVKSFIAPVKRKVLGQAQKSGKLQTSRPPEQRKFRASSATMDKAQANSAGSKNKPKLFGSTKDDVDFLNS